MECGEQGPHIWLAFSSAISQGQLFVFPIGQWGFDTPAHQPPQWRDIKGADWLAAGEGCVQEGD